MAKAYSLLSWNVEHFKVRSDGDSKARLQRIVSTIKSENPDVFALYEVEGKEVFTELITHFPSYSFHITEGTQVQEILVGVRGNISAFFTQKLEFKSSQETLRPGALLTLTIDSVHYPILFLHLKSFDDPRSFGLRDDMISKAIKFASKLKTGNQNANYLFIGDLNTMGLDYYFDRDISVDLELKKSDTYASRYYDMVRLPKTYANSWWNGSGSSYDESPLDHCYAARHLSFKLFANKSGTGKSPVDVRGWADKPTTAEKDQWIADYSDHCYLYLEVQKI